MSDDADDLDQELDRLVRTDPEFVQVIFGLQISVSTGMITRAMAEYQLQHLYRRKKWEARAGVAARRSAEPPTIYDHGGNSYSMDGVRPIRVSVAVANVLAVFAKRDQALLTSEIETESGYDGQAPKLMKKINRSFPGTVRFPKERDGYYVRVRPAPGR
ncbi:MAG TPA: hypothetical protein VM533_14080 [Fimbriiglobus sp.]|jgi:hypothetical protein|nr:hypothetical protein [Fimbriiglobus sp.]